MRRATAHAFRIATVLVLLAAAVQVFRLTNRHAPSSERVETQAGALTVGRAIADQPMVATGVRGYVFDGGGTGPRLCDTRRRSTPPVCIGPFLDLYEFDGSALPFKHGRAGAFDVRWVERAVTLYGSVQGTAFHVTQISQ